MTIRQELDVLVKVKEQKEGQIKEVNFIRDSLVLELRELDEKITTLKRSLPKKKNMDSGEMMIQIMRERMTKTQYESLVIEANKRVEHQKKVEADEKSAIVPADEAQAGASVQESGTDQDRQPV